MGLEVGGSFGSAIKRFPSLGCTFCTSALARRRIVSKLARLEVVVAIFYRGATKPMNMKYISGSA